MLRPLLTLVGGIVGAVLLAVLISGGRDLGAVLGPILVTTAVGVAVFAIVARRSRIRDAAEALAARDQLREVGIELPDPALTDSTHQEPDHG